ncbi:MAG: T9SS type A sorting domain-containing protein [Bacteroidota bacterium]
MKLHLILFFLFLGYYLFSQNFTEASSSSTISPIVLGAIAFSDVDKDGDQDVLITGIDVVQRETTKLYLNDGEGSFTAMTNTPFEPVAAGCVAFADIDNDGDQDVLITGTISTDPRRVVSRLYTNDGAGIFTVVTNTPFRDLTVGEVAFADVDGDGDQDVLLTGGDNSLIPHTELYINDGTGNFKEQTVTPFEDVFRSALAFADVDQDGDQDLLLTGQNIFGEFISRLYTNDGTGNFTNSTASFLGARNGTTVFSDVDNDGDQDVLIAGWDNDFIPRTRLYINDGTGNFTVRSDISLANIVLGAAVFFDMDNDGDSDLLLSGSSATNTNNVYLDRVMRLYENDGRGNFAARNEPAFDRVVLSKLALADIDSDGDTDILSLGRITRSTPSVKLYINQQIISSTDGTYTDIPFDFSVFPNPAPVGAVNISFEMKQAQWVTISIFDLSGRILYQQQQFLSVGKQHISIEGSTLTSGNYFLQLTGGNERSSSLFSVE